MNQGMSESTYILSGWKDIANYLGKGVRTVQRYEGELRLPVRRPAGKTRGSVVATTAELDAWISASPVRAEFHGSAARDPLYGGSRAAIRQGIQEMRTLRAQMRGLRDEMIRSVSSLQKSIQSIQRDVSKTEHEVALASRVSSSGTLQHLAAGDLALLTLN